MNCYRQFLMLFATALCLNFCLLSTVFARGNGFFTVDSIEGNYVSAGMGLISDYPGSDDYEFGVAPSVRYEFGAHRNIELVGNYLHGNLIDSDNWRLGPALLYRFGRDDDVDDKRVSELEEIDDTIEAGLVLSYQKILNNNPRNRFAVSVDFLQDVADEHNGLSATASTRYWNQLSKAIDFGVIASLQYANSNFTDTYFGVDAASSAASGLDTFDADGGIKSTRLISGLIFHLSEQWHLGAGLRWEYLVGDAADSPIVDDRGDRNQFIGGIAIAYSWGAKVDYSLQLP